jgi:hypothetical protein
VLCILEVLASLTLAPQVADAAMPPSEFLAQVGGWAAGGLRGCPLRLLRRCPLCLFGGCPLRMREAFAAARAHPDVQDAASAAHCSCPAAAAAASATHRPPQVVATLRARPEVAARGRERTHLLLLYGALCGCVTCREPRVREFVSHTLLLAGAELGLGTVALQQAAEQAGRRRAGTSAAAEP